MNIYEKEGEMPMPVCTVCVLGGNIVAAHRPLLGMNNSTPRVGYL